MPLAFSKHHWTLLGILVTTGTSGTAYAASQPDYSIPEIPEVMEESSQSSWWPQGSEARLSGVFSALHGDVVEAGPFNPNNFAGLPDDGLEAELRPDFKIPLGDECTTNLKPRFRATRLEINGETQTEKEFFFNSAYVDCTLGYTTEITAGRQLLQWGNGQFRSPSNPFFAESVLFNPVQEILGKDFITVGYRPSMDWGLTYIALLGDSNLDPGHDRFERAHGIKLDWTGRWFNGGVLGSQREGHPWRLSGYSTFTLSDAVILYGEGTVSRDTTGLLPAASGENILLPASEVDERTRGSLLLGGSYTFENGTTAYLEYLHSTEAFNDRQADDWLAIARDAAEGLEGPDALSSASTLGNAIDPGWNQLRNNYLFLQLARTEYLQKADLALRYVQNLEDSSYEISTAVTLRLGDNAEWFLVGSRNFGGAETEFGRLYRYTVQTGLRIYAF